MFSAVALIAFSVTGMANNGGKDVETKETKKVEKVVKTNCSSYATSSVQAETLAYGPMSFDEYAEAYTFYFNTCQDANNSGATLLDPVFVG